MAKMKVFELKNLINKQKNGVDTIESRDIQDFIEKSKGIKKTHSSNLEENEVADVRKHFLPQSQKPASTGQKPVATQGVRQDTSSQRASSGNRQQSDRPRSQEQGQRNSSYNQRPQGQQGQRPSGSSNYRPNDGSSQGQQGQRTSYNQRQDGGRPQGQRTYGQGQQSQQDQQDQQGQRTSYNQRQDGQGQRTSYNQRQDGQGQQGQRTYGQGQQGQQGQRPYGQGQQGQRPYGQGQQGQQGQRPYGQGQQGQQGQRPYGQGQQGQQGQRPYGQGQQGQQGQRPYGQGQQGQQGQRPYGQGQQGQRPYGQGQQGQQGQRPAGSSNYRSNDGNRPYNQNRPGGQRPGGYNSGYNSGYNKDKDEDQNTNQHNSSARGGNRRGTAAKGDRKTFDQQILDKKVAEKSDNNNKRNRDRINKEKSYKDKNGTWRKRDVKSDAESLAPKKGQFIKPKQVVKVEEEIKVVTAPEVLTIKELADKMKKPASVIVKKLFLAGKMVSINSEITFEEAEEIAIEYDIIVEKEIIVNEVEELLKEEDEDPTTLKKRPPVVCVMGHVDHGKTSLLDAIRETHVTTKEAGGITQAIGASVAEINGETITFLDTPGHEAFTSMRMRGAKSTDVAILVVAADDGVMPQTVEAISHAKAAEVQIIVAINKIDKPSANIDRVKQELTEYELIAEDWGGDTIFVPVSAHTGEGIDQLLEMIVLASDVMELKANPDRNARGVVIEAKLDKGRGPVATILIQKGTLHVGDNVVVGACYGKVRAMVDDRGQRVQEATPSTPVEIIGLNEVPDAGEIFMATDSEKEARAIADAFISQGKEKLISDTKAKLSLDGLFSQIKAGSIKELTLIIKADVQGSVEAMKQSLVKLSNDEVAVRIVHGGVGAINESDVILASTSNAVIIGFNVKPDNAAKETSNRENVDIKLYRVIYNAIDDVEAAMKGMLDPIFEEKVIGHAEIRQTFKASGIGTIAGSYVLDGKIQRGSKTRVYRGEKLIFEGDLASLKRFQDDVKEVNTGYECGLVFEKFNDVQEGDRVEVYIMAEVPR